MEIAYDATPLKRFRFFYAISTPSPIRAWQCRSSGSYTHSPMGWLFLREIMTTVYFAKRCKSDRKVIDERNRPLTDEGVSASYKVMEILKDKKNRCIYF